MNSVKSVSASLHVSRKVLLVVALALTLLGSSVITQRMLSVKAQPPVPQRGPRAPGLECIFYPNSAAEYAALVAGDVDYVGMLTAPQYYDATTRPDIATYLETTYTVVGEAMMSAYYMPSNPDWRNPMNDTSFRKAIMHLVHKDYYIENIYQGLAERIDVPVAAPSAAWMNQSLIGANYPYPYSQTLAIQRLECDGWVDFDAERTRYITIHDLAFSPQSLSIQTGDRLVWRNNDPVIYTLWFVHTGDQTTYEKVGSEGLSEPILPGESWSWVFDEPVELQYYCFERLWITGFISVQERDETRNYPPGWWCSPGEWGNSHVAVDVPSGSTEITVDDAIGFGVSDDVIIWTPYDWSPCWPEGVTYELAHIVAITDNTLTLDHALSNTYHACSGVMELVNIHPLQYWIYDDPPTRYEQAHHLAEELRDVGIPVDENVAPWQFINDRCWCAYDYHLATDGWALEAEDFGQPLKTTPGGLSLGRLPPTYLWFWFHSQFWMPGYCGPNTYYPGNPTLDAALEAALFATNIPAAVFAGEYAQSLIMDKYCLWIPILSEKGFYATKDLCGVVKMNGGTPFNHYAEMHTYRVSAPSQPIRVGLDSAPNINTIYAMWTNAYMIMQRAWADTMTLYPLSPGAPEQPALLKDWESTSWFDGVTMKTLCKYWLRDGASWIKSGDPGVDPDAGKPIAPFNATGMEFGIWYMYQTTDAWWHADYKHIHHVRTDPTDPYYIEYYWDQQSIFFYLMGWSTHIGIYSLEPGKYFKQTPLVLDGDLVTAGLQPSTAVFVEGTNVTTPGNLWLPHQTVGAPVEIVSIVSNVSGTLTPSDIYSDNDYEIVRGYIHLYKNLAANEKITVTYWARDDARGTTAGNIPWQETIVGAGKWYMTSWNILTGATFKPNRYHHLETPPLAETDWMVFWDGFTKPRDSYYKVTIYDVSLTTAIYGSQGRLVPDPYWDPTMDLAPSADGLPGIIDIYDVSSITANYGKSFWKTS